MGHMQHPYSAVITRKGRARLFPCIQGELYENDVLIAKFKRGAVKQGCVPDLEYRFLSTASRNRFQDFADCTSIAESIEALLPL